MTPDSRTDTEIKLEHVEKRLLAEFPDVQPEPVLQEAHVVEEQLLRRARFTDYVPVLVHRFMRERLLDRRRARRAQPISH